MKSTVWLKAALLFFIIAHVDSVYARSRKIVLVQRSVDSTCRGVQRRFESEFKKSFRSHTINVVRFSSLYRISGNNSSMFVARMNRQYRKGFRFVVEADCRDEQMDSVVAHNVLFVRVHKMNQLGALSVLFAGIGFLRVPSEDDLHFFKKKYNLSFHHSSRIPDFLKYLKHYFRTGKNLKVQRITGSQKHSVSQKKYRVTTKILKKNIVKRLPFGLDVAFVMYTPLVGISTAIGLLLGGLNLRLFVRDEWFVEFGALFGKSISDYYSYGCDIGAGYRFVLFRTISDAEIAVSPVLNYRGFFVTKSGPGMLYTMHHIFAAAEIALEVGSNLRLKVFFSLGIGPGFYLRRTLYGGFSTLVLGKIGLSLYF
ncbi:hypothetical protein KKH43_03465 [Patescibacteria group bacterium]|nr:hypothetical protein [Patescibacteria group bacterium]